MSKYGGENRNIPNLMIPTVFVTSEDEEDSPPLTTNEFTIPMNRQMSQLSYVKDDDVASTAPLLDSGMATPLEEEPLVPLSHLETILRGNFIDFNDLHEFTYEPPGPQKLKPDLNMEEIGLTTFDNEKKNEASGKSKINLPQYSIVSWPWDIIRYCLSVITCGAIFCAFIASAILTADLPQRCDPDTEWWQGKVFYEIFPASFHDSNYDGIGDLNGLAMKLDYLKSRLNVDVVQLSSIFEAKDYSHSYLDIINSTKVDPQLGNMKDFQDLIASVAKNNLSLVLDLYVDHLPGITGISTLTEEANLVVEDTIKFWLRQGVHGFFLKGLDRFIQQEDFGDKITQWKKMINSFNKGFIKPRILITTSSFLIGYSQKHPKVSEVQKQFDLVNHFLHPERIDTMADQIKQGLRWNDATDSPWILWSLANVDAPRLDHSSPPGKRQCSGSNAALMLALGLPGSVSIYYDYEMGLQMPHNSKVETLSAEKVTSVCYNLSTETLGAMAAIRRDAVPLHYNVVAKYDAKGVLESRFFNYIYSLLSNSTAVIERSYPRRHRYLLITNLSGHNVTHDLSKVYFGGQTLFSSTGDKYGYVQLKNFNMMPAEGLLLLLDR